MIVYVTDRMGLLELIADGGQVVGRSTHRECRDCGRNVASDADACPDCGGGVAVYAL